MAATLHNLGHVALEERAWEQSHAYFEKSRILYTAFDLRDYRQGEDSMIDYVR